MHCDPKWCMPLREKNLPAIPSPQDPLPPPLAQTVRVEGNLPPSPSPATPTDNKQRAAPQRKSYYRCMKVHRVLYNQMAKKFEPFTTTERLVELMHEFDTQTNEALNRVIAKYAPKDRTYSTTMSLSNRIAIVTGIHNDGHHAFWTNVFKRIRLPINAHLDNNLNKCDRTKLLKKKYSERKEVKLVRVKSHIEKVKELMNKQKKMNFEGLPTNPVLRWKNWILFHLL